MGPTVGIETRPVRIRCWPPFATIRHLVALRKSIHSLHPSLHFKNEERPIRSITTNLPNALTFWDPSSGQWNGGECGHVALICRCSVIIRVNELCTALRSVSLDDQRYGLPREVTALGPTLVMWRARPRMNFRIDIWCSCSPWCGQLGRRVGCGGRLDCLARCPVYLVDANAVFYAYYI